MRTARVLIKKRSLANTRKSFFQSIGHHKQFSSFDTPDVYPQYAFACGAFPPYAFLSVAAFRLVYIHMHLHLWRLSALYIRKCGGFPRSLCFFGGLPLLNVSSLVVSRFVSVASRLMPVAPDLPQWSTALLAVSRLYIGPPLYAYVAHICVVHLRVAYTRML